MCPPSPTPSLCASWKISVCVQFSLLIPFSQLESTLREKSQQLESLQEIKVNLEEQLKKETAAKVIMFIGHLI